MEKLIFSDESILQQINEGEYASGIYKLKFYSKNGIPVSEETNEISEYYLYPKGGVLRDWNYNIISYQPHFDTYKGFKIPTEKG